MSEKNKGTMIPALAAEFAEIAGADAGVVQEMLEDLQQITGVLGLNGKDLMSPKAFDTLIKNRVDEVNENNF